VFRQPRLPNKALLQTAGHDSFILTTTHRWPAAAELKRYLHSYLIKSCLFRVAAENDHFRNGRQVAIWPAPATATYPFAGVSKLIDAVAFWHSYGVPETHLRTRSDTRRSRLPKKRSNKRTILVASGRIAEIAATKTSSIAP
jgi:hypothetical protein